MTIRKGSFTFTFLFDDAIRDEAFVAQMDVADIIAACDEDMMGQASGMTIGEVPNDKVADEECAMGGDGTFFADPDALWDKQNGQDGN